MNKRILPLLILFTTACNMQGVEDLEGQSETSVFDSIPVIDSTGLNKTELLSDSINGRPNDLVLQKENGLRVEWEIKSDNQRIQANDVVMINYKSRVAGGEQYDSNEAVGQPVPVRAGIGMLVKGMEQGLLEMAPGDKGRIMIPNALGYGEDGYMTIVPPKADLIIDIEIESIIQPIELENGVKVYKWKEESRGIKPKKNQWIIFDYFAYTQGKDGHMYDNSFKNGEPYKMRFENDNLIDGLHIGMSALREGENAMIHIPAKMAYGSKGIVDLVPKNTDLIYDVRILEITD